MRTTRRSRPHVACLVAMLALSVCTGADAAQIDGRLLNGTFADGVLGGHAVRLTAQIGGSERLDVSATSDGDGRFVFADLPGDTADVYVLSTEYAGVDYVSGFLRFALGESSLNAELLVFETTSDLTPLRLNARHYVFEIKERPPGVAVTEVLAIGNLGQRTILPEGGIRLAVPRGARAVEVVEGFSSARAVDPERAAEPEVEIVLEGAIRPGTFRYEGAFRYALPADLPLAVAIAPRHPVDEMTVLVAPIGSRVEGPGVRPIGVVDLGGGVVTERFEVTLPPAPNAYTFTVHAPSTRADRTAFLVVALVAALFGVLLWAREKGDAGPSRAAGPDLRLSAERDRYLSEILALEAAHANGRVESYELERARLVAKASAIQELLDEREESRT